MAFVARVEDLSMENIDIAAKVLDAYGEQLRERQIDTNMVIYAIIDIKRSADISHKNLQTGDMLEQGQSHDEDIEGKDNDQIFIETTSSNHKKQESLEKDNQETCHKYDDPETQHYITNEIISTCPIIHVAAADKLPLPLNADKSTQKVVPEQITKNISDKKYMDLDEIISEHDADKLSENTEKPAQKLVSKCITKKIQQI
ncbi:hypothetical protein O0L34_g19072 [Tuta absoluta]|nr:hypothetical protein O0L34_g19072 [Tuta absoluta]